MEKFKEVFRKFGAEVTNVSTNDLGVDVEIKTPCITSQILDRIKLIQGKNNHIYLFRGIEAINKGNEIYITLWYIDLSKVQNVPIN